MDVHTWFARRTYHMDDLDVDDLAARKAAQGMRVSVVLPSRNEVETIGGVVGAAMALRGQLVDEIVVLDGGSTDGTRELAEAAGAQTFDDSEVLGEFGPGLGKGDALWRSLAVTSGDVVVFVDADIRNPDSRFVWGPLGPLLLDPEIQLVKGFYERPIQMAGTTYPTGGGRVTELTARPLLNLFWPELAGLAEPLSGEYAGRRALLESVPFFTGYGVEIGMLIDTLASGGLDVIAQVDLGERIHTNQPLDALSRMAFEIIQVARRRLAVEDLPDRYAQFLRSAGGRLELIEQKVQTTERPPLRDLLGYARGGV
ncbi:MAG: glucosyl-3-phosphoglycerate synthase [Egibacteraceae bacterium]